MDNILWVAGQYPAGICIFALLCQYSLHISQDEVASNVATSKEGKTFTHTGDAKIIPEQGERSQDELSSKSSQNHSLPNIIHSRGKIWSAAFWLSLQYYAFLKLGSKIRLAEQEQEGFVWTAMIALFPPTIVNIISTTKLCEAMQRVESHQKSSTGPNKPYFLTAGMVGFTFFLVLIPWIQAFWVLLWS